MGHTPVMCVCVRENKWKEVALLQNQTSGQILAKRLSADVCLRWCEEAV